MDVFVAVSSDAKQSDLDLDLDSFDMDASSPSHASHARTASQDMSTQHMEQSMEMLQKLCGMWKGEGSVSAHM